MWISQNIISRKFNEEYVLIKKVITFWGKVPNVKFHCKKQVGYILAKSWEYITHGMILLLDFYVSKDPSLISLIDQVQYQIFSKYLGKPILKEWIKHFPFDMEILRKPFLEGNYEQVKYILELFPLCKNTQNMELVIGDKFMGILTKRGDLFDRVNDYQILITHTNIKKEAYFKMTKIEYDDMEQNIKNPSTYIGSMTPTIVYYLLNLKNYEFDKLSPLNHEYLNEFEGQCDIDFCLRQYILHRNVNVIWKLIFKRKYIIDFEQILILETFLENIDVDVIINIYTLWSLLIFWDHKDDRLKMFKDYDIVWPKIESK
jgi:hypothetical protein